MTLYKRKTSKNFIEAIKINFKKANFNLKSITSNNGVENAKMNLLTNNWCATHAYSSWKREALNKNIVNLENFFQKVKDQKLIKLLKLKNWYF